jgi:cytochrome o ubiquinol oxidase subunit 3
MTRGADPYALGHRGGRHDGGGHDGGTHGRGGDGSTGHGIFLLSDIVMFLGFSASYAVLAGATADGPGGDILFDLGRVKRETACLLLSRYACGLAGIAAARGNMAWTHIGLLVTGLLGAVFLFLEVQEFAQMIAEGAGPQRSAFLSAFFALVGCRGLHAGIGLWWLATMMAQIFVKGFRADVMRRVTCFNLFWHALDIVWIALITIVYLSGQAQ